MSTAKQVDMFPDQLPRFRNVGAIGGISFKASGDGFAEAQIKLITTSDIPEVDYLPLLKLQRLFVEVRLETRSGIQYEAEAKIVKVDQKPNTKTGRVDATIQLSVESLTPHVDLQPLLRLIIEQVTIHILGTRTTTKEA